MQNVADIHKYIRKYICFLFYDRTAGYSIQLYVIASGVANTHVALLTCNTPVPLPNPTPGFNIIPQSIYSINSILPVSLAVFYTPLWHVSISRTLYTMWYERF